MMKKLIAFMLVVIMVLSLVACKKPVDPGDGTTGTQTNEKPYKGKTLQIWGMEESANSDWDTFGNGNFNWMIKAAILEWAEANEVKLEWKGNYNQNALLSAINAGQKPDLLLRGSGTFPAIANYGITTPFTAEECAKFTEVIDKGFLDASTFKGEVHGVVYPWCESWMLLYNKTMFENYDIKSPYDYFMEGTWNWTNFQKAMEEVTRDIDGDGKMDTYGLNHYAFNRFAPMARMDDTGRLINILDDPISWDYMNFRYTQGTIKQTIMSSSDKITTLVTLPRYAMQISVCDPINFASQYVTLSNGDEIRAVPVPYWDGGDQGTWYSQALADRAFSMLNTCDEREATVDLIVYVLKCGMKYMADISLGTIKSDYPGVAGTCEYSKNWKEHFAQVIANRQEEIKTVGYDEQLAKKINEYYADPKVEKYATNMTFAGVTVLGDWSAIAKNPPATAIAEIREQYEAQLKTYNDLYVYD